MCMGGCAKVASQWSVREEGVAEEAIRVFVVGCGCEPGIIMRVN